MDVRISPDERKAIAHIDGSYIVNPPKRSAVLDYEMRTSRGASRRAASAARVLRQTFRSLGDAFDDFRGVAPASKDHLDLVAMELPAENCAGRRAKPRVVDLTSISQVWLRDLLRRRVEVERPMSRSFNEWFKALSLASTVLARRPGGGRDPAALTAADMDLVVAAFKDSRRGDGNLYTSKVRGRQLGSFFDMLEFGLRAELLGSLSSSFTRRKEHRVREEEENEDELGKAIPEYVIRQLDAAMDSISVGHPYGWMADDDVAAMFRTVYILLRDTGRRPWEIAALPRNCLDRSDGDISLVWNNRKGGRMRRRLPITRSTAADIESWIDRRDGLLAPARSENYLFPCLTERSGHDHMKVTSIAAVVRSWVRALPRLDSDVPGPDGMPLPFDRALIYPRAFRHSYAQRHADAGTPVDVLRELMDHRSVQTTMRYYKVSLRRKREAVRLLSSHVVDRYGNAAASSPAAYQMRSVAVPFGNCTEPSNIKAGGQSCPIRFQCAGCGFYRPDPSYLPAIEDHVRSLKADRETVRAADAAEFVLRNLTDQIGAFQEVTEGMRRRMEELPEGERDEIEEAGRLLRRVRAGEHRKQLPLLPTPRASQEPS